MMPSLPSEQQLSIGAQSFAHFFRVQSFLCFCTSGQQQTSPLSSPFPHISTPSTRTSSSVSFSDFILLTGCRPCKGAVHYHNIPGWQQQVRTQWWGWLRNSCGLVPLTLTLIDLTAELQLAPHLKYRLQVITLHRCSHQLECKRGV
jgi:hypothetical protein